MKNSNEILNFPKQNHLPLCNNNNRLHHFRPLFNIVTDSSPVPILIWNDSSQSDISFDRNTQKGYTTG